MISTFSDVLENIKKYNDLHDEMGRFASKGADEKPSSKAYKKKQLEIIRESNPVQDDVHTWIRSTEDIGTFDEVIERDCHEGGEYEDCTAFAPDYTLAMAMEAIKSGKITVYSSHRIGQGVFVTPSKMEAGSYGGTGDCNEKTVELKDVAWIDPLQGQYAKVS